MDEFNLSIKEFNMLGLCRRTLHNILKELLLGKPVGYVGEGEVRLTFPEFHEVLCDEGTYTIELFTFSLGTHDKYTWEGLTLLEALEKFKRQLDTWVMQM